VDHRAEVDAGRRGARCGCPGGHDDDHTAVLRRDQHVPVTEAVDDDPLQHDGRAVHAAVGVAWLRERHVVVLAQVDPERLGARHHPGHVGVPAEQVVDELAAQCLLVADHVAPLGLVTVDEDTDGVVEHAEDRLGGAAHLLRVGRPHHHRQLPPQAPAADR
jgi:hypothetical protein